MYSKKKIIKNLILVFAILIILIITVFSLGDIKTICDVLIHQTNYAYIAICVALILLYCFFFQLSLTILIKHKYKEISIVDSMYISGSEFFFNGITPFSSGGQPFQAYALKAKKMKLSDSTSALLINFLAYQIVMNLFSVVCLCVYFSKLKSQIDNLIWLVIVGFSINILMMLFIILIGTTKFAGNLMVKFLRLLCKIKFINKFLGNKIEAFQVYVSEMQNAFKEMAQSKRIMLFVFLTKILALFCYYSIPFFIFYAIGVDLTFKDLFYVISMTSFALTISVWVPTPGASGGAELAFTTLFSGLLSGYPDANNLAVSGMLLWRLLTYYFIMVYGFIMYILFERRNKNEDRTVY